MVEPKLFGKRVRAIRRAARITQEKAAETAHLNSKYLGEIERGEKRPSFEVIIALARALRVSPATFFQFDGEVGDERTLRRKIEILLGDTNPQQLVLVYKILRAFLEP
jgi:transcriptional regulator with XRE-family HTH domain